MSIPTSVAFCRAGSRHHGVVKIGPEVKVGAPYNMVLRRARDGSLPFSFSGNGGSSVRQALWITGTRVHPFPLH